MKTLPKGHQSILSREFKYVPAANTDVAATFARVKAQQKRELLGDKKPQLIKVHP